MIEIATPLKISIEREREFRLGASIIQSQSMNSIKNDVFLD